MLVTRVGPVHKRPFTQRSEGMRHFKVKQGMTGAEGLSELLNSRDRSRNLPMPRSWTLLLKRLLVPSSSAPRHYVLLSAIRVRACHMTNTSDPARTALLFRPGATVLKRAEIISAFWNRPGQLIIA